MKPEANFLIHHVGTSVLDVAYEEHGLANGDPIVLLHGFPYDPRGYDAMVPTLAAAGYRDRKSVV